MEELDDFQKARLKEEAKEKRELYTMLAFHAFISNGNVRTTSLKTYVDAAVYEMLGSEGAQ